jgi:hypothetical protein
MANHFPAGRLIARGFVWAPLQLQDFGLPGLDTISQ